MTDQAPTISLNEGDGRAFGETYLAVGVCLPAELNRAKAAPGETPRASVDLVLANSDGANEQHVTVPTGDSVQIDGATWQLTNVEFVGNRGRISLRRSPSPRH